MLPTQVAQCSSLVLVAGAVTSVRALILVTIVDTWEETMVIKIVVSEMMGACKHWRCYSILAHNNSNSAFG